MENKIFLNINNEITSSSSNFNYEDLIERFIRYIDVSNNTMNTYKRSLKQFGKYMANNGINMPTREDIISYKEYLSTFEKPNTINLYITSLKNFYKWLEYEEITKDITKNIKLIKMDRKHLKRALTEDEVKQIMETCNDSREKTLMALSLTCALRSNEIVNIKVEDFYEENGCVMLKILGKGKTSKVESVKIDNRVLELIKKYIQEYQITDYLFTSTSNNNKGGKLNTITIRRIFNDLCERANINRERCSFHSCRHFSATESIKKGMSLLETSEMLRHANVSTTQIYVDEINKSESKFASTLGDVVFND